MPKQKIEDYFVYTPENDSEIMEDNDERILIKTIHIEGHICVVKYKGFQWWYVGEAGDNTVFQKEAE